MFWRELEIFVEQFGIMWYQFVFEMCCILVYCDLFDFVMCRYQDGFVWCFVDVLGFYFDKVVFYQVEVIDFVYVIEFVEVGQDCCWGQCFVVQRYCIIVFEIDGDIFCFIGCVFWMISVLIDDFEGFFGWIFQYFIF